MVWCPWNSPSLRPKPLKCFQFHYWYAGNIIPDLCSRPDWYDVPGIPARMHLRGPRKSIKPSALPFFSPLFFLSLFPLEGPTLSLGPHEVDYDQCSEKHVSFFLRRGRPCIPRRQAQPGWQQCRQISACRPGHKVQVRISSSPGRLKSSRPRRYPACVE